MLNFRSLLGALDRHKVEVLAATTVVVLGGLLAYAGLHGVGFVVEVVGLYMVALAA